MEFTGTWTVMGSPAGCKTCKIHIYRRDVAQVWTTEFETCTEPNGGIFLYLSWCGWGQVTLRWSIVSAGIWISAMLDIRYAFGSTVSCSYIGALPEYSYYIRSWSSQTGVRILKLYWWSSFCVLGWTSTNKCFRRLRFFARYHRSQGFAWVFHKKLAPAHFCSVLGSILRSHCLLVRWNTKQWWWRLKEYCEYQVCSESVE